jgi:hypothetical protein
MDVHFDLLLVLLLFAWWSGRMNKDKICAAASPDYRRRRADD